MTSTNRILVGSAVIAALMSHSDTQRHLEERFATLKTVSGVEHGTIQKED